MFTSRKFTGNTNLYKTNMNILGRVFANCPGDLGSIPGRVIPKTLKWYLIITCLTLGNIRYVSRVKWSNPGKWVTPSSTPRCRSYWKGSLWVANFTFIIMYILFFRKYSRVQERELSQIIAWILNQNIISLFDFLFLFTINDFLQTLLLIRVIEFFYLKLSSCVRLSR